MKKHFPHMQNKPVITKDQQWFDKFDLDGNVVERVPVDVLVVSFRRDRPRLKQVS